jgi:hypothetical protein
VPEVSLVEMSLLQGDQMFVCKKSLKNVATITLLLKLFDNFFCEKDRPQNGLLRVLLKKSLKNRPNVANSTNLVTLGSML